MLTAALLFACLAQEIPDLGTRKAGVDWPCFLGPNHDGTTPETGLNMDWSTPPPVVWRRELGDGYSTGVVSKGRLFLFDRVGDKNRLVCLKSETGEELWKYEYATSYADSYGAGNGPRCCPVVDMDRVYLFDPDGLLTCVKTADGSLVWKKDTSKEYGVVPNFFGVGSTPVVEGEVLIAMIGGSPPKSPPIASGETPGLDSGIVGFDKRTGDEKYRLSSELASYSSPLVKTVNQRRQGLVYARNGLVAFDPVTGKMDFHHPWRAASVTTVNIANPVVEGNRVLISEAYGVGSCVLELSSAGPRVLWQDGRKRERALMAYWNTPVASGPLVFCSNGMGSDADLRCIDIRNGKVYWSAPELKQCSLTAAVDMNMLIALSEDGVLRLVKILPERCIVMAETTIKDAKGTPLIEAPARAAPVLSHGLLYLRGNGRLVCVDLTPPK
jgi:outer membrane protein assembly factor BamB